MATPAARTTQRGARDHGFHPVPIRRVVPETAESASFVLDVPPDLRDAFAYEAGQFLTFRVEVAGEAHLRCYSMSSSPAVDDDLAVTVKRVPGGAVSNRMIDELGPGSVVEVTRPAGVFCLGPGDGDIVAFGAGSGITPIFSLLKTALATTERRVRLLYANRDRDAVIFGSALDALVERHPGRLEVAHHLDVEHGYVDAEALRPFAAAPADAEFFVCGPGPFMDIVETTLLDGGVDADRIHIERFSPATEVPPAPASPPGSAEPNGDDAGATETVVTIELDGTVDSVAYHPGTTILQTARQMGMAPPYSCESGSCATCMARLVEGTATMYVNNALDDDEVEEGWVLTCQAVPTSSVRVVYGDEE
ncbi:MAG TPA: ferredoxin--NADP reductase [Acidimicrobiales bacterium]|nr:ferredoxin--NADP reductase [Acidimicrobiales bacterium]